MQKPVKRVALITGANKGIGFQIASQLARRGFTVLMGARIAGPDSTYGEVLSPAYRMSKTLLNGITVLLAKELYGTNILVNSACPGWVRTDMGGERAPLSPEQGADTPVWLATLPDGGPTAGFFRNRQPIPW